MDALNGSRPKQINVIHALSRRRRAGKETDNGPLAKTREVRFPWNCLLIKILILHLPVRFRSTAHPHKRPVAHVWRTIKFIADINSTGSICHIGFIFAVNG